MNQQVPHCLSPNFVAFACLALICTFSTASGQSLNPVNEATNRHEGIFTVVDLPSTVSEPPNSKGIYESEGIDSGSVPSPQGGVANFFVLDPEVKVGVFGALSRAYRFRPKTDLAEFLPLSQSVLWRISGNF